MSGESLPEGRVRGGQLEGRVTSPWPLPFNGAAGRPSFLRGLPGGGVLELLFMRGVTSLSRQAAAYCDPDPAGGWPWPSDAASPVCSGGSASPNSSCVSSGSCSSAVT